MGKRVKASNAESGSSGVKERRKRPRPLLEQLDEGEKQLATGSGVGESRFAKALGSTDFHTREKGLAALTRWLASKSKVEEDDLLKLWKGIFYCFWHSDKAPVQEDLAKRLAEAQLQLKPRVAFMYFSVSIKTLRREWFGIDYLRMDKFLLLIRHFVRQMLVLLQRSGWDDALVGKYMAEIERGCLLPSDTHPALSVAYHLSDIWVDEIDTVADGAHLPAPVLLSLLEPFLSALRRSSIQALLNRIRDGVFAAAASRCESGEGAMAALDSAHVAEVLFEAAAGTVTSQKNRVVLYDLNKTWTSFVKKPSKEAVRGSEQAIANGDQPKGSKAAKAAKAPKPKKGEVVTALDVAVDAADDAGMTGGPAKKPKLDKPAGQAGEVVKEESKKKKKKAAKGTESPAADVPDSVIIDAGHTPMPKKAKKKAAVAADSGSAPSELPLSSAKASARKAAAGSSQGQTPQKKSVRFSMKNNLYFKHGGPVADIDVRTPPRARPKGPALKAMSAFGGPQFHSPALRQGSGKKRQAPRTPRSAPRPSASDFF